MSETPRTGPNGPTSRPSAAPLPQAVIRKSKPFSIIWLIPVVAALTGGFLAWKAISEKGPTVTILFDDAEGLQVEKTKVKYKDVEIGVVESIQFTKDLSQVEVTASLTKQTEPYLTENTRFWVVTAQVSAGQVTGLGTLLGGAYIGVDLSDQGKLQDEFVGLATAPIVTSEDEGSFYTLRAESLGSLGVGAPVYYRSLKVGQIVAYEMDESGDFFTLQAFVRAPHDKRIDTQTRFWNASGFNAVIDAEGVRIDTPSLISLMIGGVSFDNLAGLSTGEPVTQETVFTLYENKADTLSPHYRRKIRFLVFFDRSVGGLAPGSPVEFRGIKLGEVVDLTLTYDFEQDEIRIPVVIEIEPERMVPVGKSRMDYSGRGLEQLVQRGLRARLASGNLLTGQLKVDLDFVEGAAPATIKLGGAYPELPTAPATLDQIANSLASTASKLDAIPIDDIGKKLDGLLGELQNMTAQINRDVAPTLTASLQSLEQTLASVDSLVGPESAVKLELEALLLDLGDTARSTRLLTERLEQYPEDLLRGKSR